VATVVLVIVAAAFDVINRTSSSGDPWLSGIAAAALGFGTSRWSSPRAGDSAMDAHHVMRSAARC
jgi:hypothetical protein